MARLGIILIVAAVVWVLVGALVPILLPQMIPQNIVVALCGDNALKAFTMNMMTQPAPM
jgi:hypothetical protein